ncbi:MAG: hypothetical protein ACYTF1_18680, partial [Planctomycetota bacterium]
AREREKLRRRQPSSSLGEPLRDGEAPAPVAAVAPVGLGISTIASEISPTASTPNGAGVASSAAGTAPAGGGRQTAIAVDSVASVAGESAGVATQPALSVLATISVAAITSECPYVLPPDAGSTVNADDAHRPASAGYGADRRLELEGHAPVLEFAHDAASLAAPRGDRIGETTRCPSHCGGIDFQVAAVAGLDASIAARRCRELAARCRAIVDPWYGDVDCLALRGDQGCGRFALHDVDCHRRTISANSTLYIDLAEIGAVLPRVVAGPVDRACLNEEEAGVAAVAGEFVGTGQTVCSRRAAMTAVADGQRALNGKRVLRTEGDIASMAAGSARSGRRPIAPGTGGECGVHPDGERSAGGQSERPARAAVGRRAVTGCAVAGPERPGDVEVSLCIDGDAGALSAGTACGAGRQLAVDPYIAADVDD